jgi:hypothetical protein
MILALFFGGYSSKTKAWQKSPMGEGAGGLARGAGSLSSYFLGGFLFFLDLD